MLNNDVHVHEHLQIVYLTTNSKCTQFLNLRRGIDNPKEIAQAISSLSMPLQFLTSKTELVQFLTYWKVYPKK